MFCTYAHYRPDGKLFYIGKGSVRRAHSNKGRNQWWNRVVSKDKSFDVQILAEWKTEQEAFDHEILLIDCFRELGHKLVNISKGGKGSVGFRHTEAHKEKMRQFMSSDKNPMLNQKTKEKQLANLKIAMNRLEVKTKQREIRLGKPLSKEHVANLKLCHPMKPVVLNGAKYISLMECSRQTGIRHGTIKRWCNNEEVKHTGKYEYIKECRWA